VAEEAAAAPVPGDRRDGSTSRPGHVEIGDQRELRHIELLGAQLGVGSHDREIPVAKLGSGLDHAAAHEVRIRIGEVGGDREEAADRHRLLLEHLAGHFVAPLAEAAQLLGSVVDGRARQLVIGVSRQPVRQQVAADPGERGDTLDVAHETTVASRKWLAVAEQTVHGDVHVAELAGHARRPSNDIA
jgi:hypothetical protein